MKSIDYESFYNDYSVSQLNCIDLSIAAYIAQQSKELYYVYCFLFAALNNYENNIFNNVVHKKDYEDAVRNEVLKLMGYSIKYIHANSKEELFQIIKDGVDSKQPVIMDVKYQTLFFYKNYKDEKETKFTTMIANGYNDKNDTVNVLDMSLERQTFSKLFKGEFLYSLQMPIDMVYEIIQKTKELISDYDSFTSNNEKSLFYIVEKTNNSPRIKNLYEASLLFFDLLSNDDMISYSLKKLSDINNYQLNALEVVMKRHINPYQIIIDGLLSLLKDNEGYEKIEEMLLNFIKNRRMMIAGLSREYIKNHFLSNDSLLACQNKIAENLCLIINVKNYIKHESITEDKNYVKGSIVTASTMLTDGTYMATRKVNLSEDCWLSKVTTINHWIQFDLLEEKDINEITIYHYGDSKMNTRDFEVLGSNDGINYSSISKIEDNKDNITSLMRLNVKYRYIKIEITNPCQFDSRARLRNVVIR